MTSRDGPAEQIVIVRRRSGNEDDHHHGGAWKIAFADFMTAMMAFFLVMWLINASNTETKASIASYFNPIKLTDPVPRNKGLLDINDKENAKERTKSGADPSDKEQGSKEKAKGAGKEVGKGSASEKAAKEAAERSADRALVEPKSDQASERASVPGQAFRDPFNPNASARLLAKEDAARTTEATAEHFASGSQEKELKELKEKELKESSEKVRREAEAAVRQAGIIGGPGIDVTIEGDSIVLSLTDTSTFGMFAIGSAEPNADLVKLIQGIKPIIETNTGRIMIRGHTDRRQFRGNIGNNNWRLAMTRAEAVYTLLVRSKIDEARFERIEAHADRKLKIERDPEAAANRRIDILLRKTDR